MTERFAWWTGVVLASAGLLSTAYFHAVQWFPMDSALGRVLWQPYALDGLLIFIVQLIAPIVAICGVVIMLVLMTVRRQCRCSAPAKAIAVATRAIGSYSIVRSSLVVPPDGLGGIFVGLFAGWSLIWGSILTPHGVLLTWRCFIYDEQGQSGQGSPIPPDC